MPHLQHRRVFSCAEDSNPFENRITVPKNHETEKIALDRSPLEICVPEHQTTNLCGSSRRYITLYCTT